MSNRKDIEETYKKSEITDDDGKYRRDVNGQEKSVRIYSSDADCVAFRYAICCS